MFGFCVFVQISLLVMKATKAKTQFWKERKKTVAICFAKFWFQKEKKRDREETLFKQQKRNNN